MGKKRFTIFLIQSYSIQFCITSVLISLYCYRKYSTFKSIKNHSSTFIKWTYTFISTFFFLSLSALGLCLCSNLLSKSIDHIDFYMHQSIFNKRRSYDFKLVKTIYIYIFLFYKLNLRCLPFSSVSLFRKLFREENM